MAAAVTSIAMRAGDTVAIDDWACVATSYPGFLDDLAALTSG
jgi:5-enolpyruvylshikimate-3-phosphate synthase